jgi:hypothetical protein
MATVRLQLRRGIADDWFDANPTLAAGEIVIETDTNTFKFGDGDTAWNDLEYALSGTVDDYIALSTKAQPGGVASLDGSGFVPASQLPPLAKVTVSAVADQAARLALTAEAGDIAIQSDNGTTYVLSASPASSSANWKEISATAAIAASISAHESDTTNVHGITDTSALVTTSGSQTLLSKSLTSPSLTGTPTAPTADAGTDTTQIATTAFVQDAIELVVGAAPSALNTLVEIATSLNNNADLSGSLTTAISAKVAKSGDTMTGALDMGSNKITSLATPTVNSDASTKSYVDSEITRVGSIILQEHNSAEVNVHGISDTANLVYNDDYRLNDLRNPNTSSVTTATILDMAVTTGKINDLAVTPGKIQDGAVITAKLADDSVTNLKLSDDAVLTAKLANGAVTTIKIEDGAVTAFKLATDSVVEDKITGGSVTTSKIADDSVTTAKIADSNITTDKINNAAVTSDKINQSAVIEGKIADGAVTTAKIADSAITTGKIAAGAVGTSDLADASVTGVKIADNAISQSHLSDDSVGTNEIGGLAVTTGKIADGAVTTAKIADGAVTKTMVGLANAENTSDANKPVSTATQTALDLKANLEAPTFTGTVVLPSTTSIGDVSSTEIGYVNGVTSSIQTQIDAKASLAGAVFTGNVEVDGSLVVDGDFTVNGTNFNASATSITIEDNMLQLAHNQAGNTVDLGLVVAYNDGTYRHAGIVRDVSESKWKLFKNVATDPTTTVDFASGSLDDLQLAALQATSIAATSATIGDVSNTELQFLNGVTSAVQTQLDSKSPIANPTFTGTVTVAASGVAFTDKTQTKAGVPSLTTIGTAVSSNTTLDALGTDAAVRDSLIPLSGAVNVSFEGTGNAKYAVGSSISFYQSSGTGANITGNGVTILSTPGGTLRALSSSVTATKIAATTWLLAGDLR